MSEARPAVTPAGAERPPPGSPDHGGDPVCWLDRVCVACGRLDDGPPPPHCPGCGAPLTRA